MSEKSQHTMGLICGKILPLHKIPPSSLIQLKNQSLASNVQKNM